MEAKDIVKTSKELCLMVCQEYRTKNFEGINCEEKDCEECALEKQAEIAFKTGQKDLKNKIDDWFSFNMPMLYEQLKNSVSWQSKMKEWGIN